MIKVSMSKDFAHFDINKALVLKECSDSIKKKIARAFESILGICFKEVCLKYCLNILNINLILFMVMLKELKEFPSKGTSSTSQSM